MLERDKAGPRAVIVPKCHQVIYLPSQIENKTSRISQANKSKDQGQDQLAMGYMALLGSMAFCNEGRTRHKQKRRFNFLG